MANGAAFSPVSTPPRLQNHKTEFRNGHLYGGITVAIVLVFVVGWFCFCFRRKLAPSFQYLCGRRKGRLDAEKLNLRRFRLEELQKATNNFSEEFLVGNGAFSNVYCGTFGVDGILAIKKPRAESYTTMEEFRNEVRLLSKVKHNNIVRLVGFCEENGPKAAKILVYEYVSNGSLLDYIMGRGGRNLTWRQRVNIAIGAAKGIAHLHEEVKPGIIHRDIKPSNILISDRFEAKVSDFGLVRSGPVGDQSHVSSLVKGTPGYLDPAYCSSFHLTPFTDVYSFGVILLQLLVARPAVESSGTNIKSHIIDWVRPSIEKGNIEEILDANLLLEGCNMEMVLKMGQLGLKCVAKEPKERPTMTQVWQELEANFNLEDHFLPKQILAMDPPRLIHRSNQSTIDYEHSQSISIDGIGLQRFHVDVDSLSFQSASLRCLETSMSMDEEGQMPIFDGEKTLPTAQPVLFFFLLPPGPALSSSYFHVCKFWGKLKPSPRIAAARIPSAGRSHIRRRLKSPETHRSRQKPRRKPSFPPPLPPPLPLNSKSGSSQTLYIVLLMASRRNIPPPHDEHITPAPGMTSRGLMPALSDSMEPLPHVLLERKSASQAAEIEQLSEDNHKLACSHIALRQDLVAALQEVEKLREHIRSIQTEGDIQIRILLDKTGKMEANIRAGDNINKELQEARVEAKSLVEAKLELTAQIQRATTELDTIRADVKKLPDMHSELDSLRQEHKRLRKVFEHEKGLNIEKVEEMKIMEKNLIRAVEEVERLQTELLNAEKRASAPIPFSAPHINSDYMYPPTFHGNGGIDNFGRPFPPVVGVAGVGMNPFTGSRYASLPPVVNGPVISGTGVPAWGGTFDGSHTQK